MRRFINPLGTVSFPCRVLSWILPLLFFATIATPAAIMVPPLFVMIITAVIWFTDKAKPQYAWLLHLVLWLVSIRFAAKLTNPRELRFYIVVAVIYVVMELLPLLFAGIRTHSQSKQRNRNNEQK